MELRPLNGRIRRVPALNANQALPANPLVVMANQPNQPNQPLPMQGEVRQPIQLRGEAQAQITFKDIKQATEALQAVIPKFTGDSPDEMYGDWCQRFAIEANALKLSRQLIASVFPRVLDGKARLKYQTLLPTEKENFGQAVQALGNKLRSQGSKSKAMNMLANIEKKQSESLIVFAKRVEGQVKIAYPRLLQSQREEIAINRFIHGCPSLIRIKLMEIENLETLDETVQKAERFEEIHVEEEHTSVNVINQVKRSDIEEKVKHLQKEIDRLTLTNQHQEQVILHMKSQLGISDSEDIETDIENEYHSDAENDYHEYTDNEYQDDSNNEDLDETYNDYDNYENSDNSENYIEDEEEPELNHILIKGEESKLPYFIIKLNGITVVALLDTGSSVSLVSQNFIRRLGLEHKVEPTSCSVKLVNGNCLKLLGKINITISVKKNLTQHDVLVVENDGFSSCILGIDYVYRINSKDQLVTFNMAARKIFIGNSVIDLIKPERIDHEKGKCVSIICTEDENISDNHVADTLSEDSLTTTDSETETVTSEIERKRKWTFDNWRQIQSQNEYLSHIKREMRFGIYLSKEGRELLEKYYFIDEVIHLIPKSNEQIPVVLLENNVPELKEFILDMHCRIGHASCEETIQFIRTRVAWKGMKQKIADVIDKCESCQLSRYSQAHHLVFPMGKCNKTYRPFERIHIDVIGPFSETKTGNRYIIAAVDEFSRFAVVKALAYDTNKATVNFLMENIVGIHGIPLQMVSEQGSSFMSDKLLEISKILQLKNMEIQAYHRQPNVMRKRFNHKLIEMLTCTTSLKQNLTDWDSKLQIIVHTYNANIHSSTGYAPEGLIFGRQTISPMDTFIEYTKRKDTNEKHLAESIAEGIKQCQEGVYICTQLVRKSAKRFNKLRIKIRTPSKSGDKTVKRLYKRKMLEKQHSQFSKLIGSTKTTATMRIRNGRMEKIHKNRVMECNKNNLQIEKFKTVNGNVKKTKILIPRKLWKSYQLRVTNNSKQGYHQNSQLRVKYGSKHGHHHNGQLRVKNGYQQMRDSIAQKQNAQMRDNNGSKHSHHQMRDNIGTVHGHSRNGQLRKAYGSVNKQDQQLCHFK